MLAKVYHPGVDLADYQQEKYDGVRGWDGQQLLTRAVSVSRPSPGSLKAGPARRWTANCGGRNSLQGQFHRASADAA
jgi:hypothetical protein